MLSGDLRQLGPVDAACRDGVDACRSALDEEAKIAAKVRDDLQHTTAEPDTIIKPVEDIRAAVRFVLLIDSDFDAGSMSVSEAVNSYMGDFSDLEQALEQLQAGG
jgi:hypothetical protein